MLIYRLENPVQRYAWGSVDGISDILGIPNPGGEPLAEIWMGAHPSAPSTAVIDGERIGLDELVLRGPREALGPKVVAELGSSLPFLFKVLSAGRPLSIQAHPSKRKAQVGFDRENLEGIPVNDPERNYRDPNHKPEMVVALTRFELICGFRPVAEIIENMRLAAPGEFAHDLERLERDPGRVELSVFFYSLISADRRLRAQLLTTASKSIAEALEGKKVAPDREGAFRWALRIMDIFPGDVGAILPLVLNHVVLEPGEAAFIAPGELHAHLTGTCLEIMANSDNVIRGALTPKFIDIPELVSVLSFNPEKVHILRPVAVASCEEAYPAIVPDFELSRISVGPGRRSRRRSRGPEILLCTSGAAEILCPGVAALSSARGDTKSAERPMLERGDTKSAEPLVLERGDTKSAERIVLERGDAVFAAADACDYEIAAETAAVVFRASVPEIP
jgi:mannose-6-phosphate isomerase